MSKEKSGYILLPDVLSQRTDINCNQKLILALLGRFQRYESHCEVPYSVIAKMLGLHKTQVQRDIKRIPQEDLRITKLPRTTQDRNPTHVYTVTWALNRTRRKLYAQRNAERKAEKEGTLVRFPEPLETA